MTIMIRRVATVLCTPLFAPAAAAPMACITRWTERRSLPPLVPAYDEDLDLYALLDAA